MNLPEIMPVTQSARGLAFPRTARAQQSHCDLYRTRRRRNRVALACSLAAMAFGLVWLCWILWETVRLGISAMSWALLSETTPPPGAAHGVGGLANAIYGSTVMVLLASAVGTPVGIMTGVYLAEYGTRNSAYKPDKLLTATTRLASDMLLSAPALLIGLFVHTVLVVPWQRFSGWAGIAALALMVIPVVTRTTENMLRLVPANLREAAWALGAPHWKVICHIVLRAARTGIVTGILLALARIAGETAPLLFTALNQQFWSTDLSQPTASLPVTIFHFALSPYDNWQRLAWAGVLLITLAALVLNLLARTLTPTQK